jgi:hypothetical protein
MTLKLAAARKENKQMFSREWFFGLDRALRDAGLDSDSESFDAIKARLFQKDTVPADEFARQAAYVILAGGFSQKTAKAIHAKIIDYLAAHAADSHAQLFDGLIAIFNNKNKINAVIKIWQERENYRGEYYDLPDEPDAKSAYLSSLPHLGKITANHLARNLGEDVVKYDIWIQRLGAVFAAQSGGRKDLASKIDNGNLDAEVKKACDDMFAQLVRKTGLPRGYIDVVLWKACQNGLIKL